MGLLNPLYYVVSWVLVQFHAFWTFIGLPADGGWTWVLSIVGLVVVIRIMLIPLVRQADQGAARTADPAARDQGDPEALQGRPAEAVRRDDEAVPGDRYQPVLVVPADPAADADLLRTLPRPELRSSARQTGRRPDRAAGAICAARHDLRRADRRQVHLEPGRRQRAA